MYLNGPFPLSESHLVASSDSFNNILHFVFIIYCLHSNKKKINFFFFLIMLCEDGTHSAPSEARTNWRPGPARGRRTHSAFIFFFLILLKREPRAPEWKIKDSSVHVCRCKCILRLSKRNGVETERRRRRRRG